MLYVCKDCGVISKGDGAQVQKPIRQATRCVKGMHDWRLIEAPNHGKTAKEAVEKFKNTKDKKVLAAAQ